MSFSYRIKQELVKQMSPVRHCRIAELAALVGFGAKAGGKDPTQPSLRFYTENGLTVKKSEAILRRTFKAVPEVMLENQSWYELYLKPAKAQEILMAMKLVNTDGSVREDLSLVSKLPIQKECCRRAYLRGAFLAAGMVSNPELDYHLEIVASSKEKARDLEEILASFGIESKSVERKGKQVVYLKDSQAIVDTLGLMDAHVALMEFENVRILKEMRNSVNRRVNCETSNIRKTVSAAVRQVEDIEFLQETGVLSELPDTLIEAAMVRLANPEATLQELGDKMDPPVGKSGVNHRLRKISELAEEYRRQ